FRLRRTFNISLPVSRAVGSKGVYVSTVHGAKGLEFETVVMADVSDDTWSTRSRAEYIKLPSDLVGLKNWQADSIEEERRLFFVAMTRAKRMLHLTYSQVGANSRTNLPCQFVSELDGALAVGKTAIEPEKLITWQKTELIPAGVRNQQAALEQFIQETITSQPFSYTHLRSYRNCPRQYLLSHIFRLPQPPNYSSVLGSVVHQALEGFFKRYQAKQKLPAVSYLLKEALEAGKNQPEIKEMGLISQRSKKLLTGFYRTHAQGWVAPVGVEYSFYRHRVTLGDIWLTGKFDRIEPIDALGRTVRVIDYKTGSRAKSLNEILGQTAKNDREILDQLLFYAVLARNDRHFPYSVLEYEISFLDDTGRYTSHRVKLTVEQVTQMEQTITDTYRRILADQEFPHTRSSFDRGCQYCQLIPD
ncbi:MAG: PD-(D/E)XK nuclease family protein, partial [Patescibacteria group bacterium]